MSWQWLNLLSTEYEGPSSPPDLSCLLYSRLRHVISAPPESAKTLAATILLLEAQRQGHLVAHVDLEMGARRTRTLLEDLGATPEEIKDLLYVEPDTPPTAGDIREIAGQCVSIVLIDAAAGAYGISGLDDNARKDVEAFAQAWVEPLYKAGIGTILLDHVVKNPDGRGRWAIGSERKAGQADVHLGLELVGNPLVRGGSALVKVRVHKDRPGWLGRPHHVELHLRSDPQTHRITWDWRPPASAPTASDEWRPTIYMERVSRHLEQHGPTSRTAIYKAGLGKGEYLVKAVNCLLVDGNLTELDSRLIPARPYRSPVTDSPIPKPFPTIPETGSAPHSPDSPPLKGGTGNGGMTGGETDADYFAEKYPEMTS